MALNGYKFFMKKFPRFTFQEYQMPFEYGKDMDFLWLKSSPNRSEIRIRTKNKFRAVRQLQNDYFIEVNLSAQSIQKFCYQAMETIELTSEDWNVSVS